jgi:hypothetical protein
MMKSNSDGANRRESICHLRARDAVAQLRGVCVNKTNAAYQAKEESHTMVSNIQQRGGAIMNRINRTILLPVFLTMSLLALPQFVKAQAYQGYTLFTPSGSRNTYLIDMSNQTAHSWTHTRGGAYSCYLLENGVLLRSAVSSNSQINGGGATGVVQKVAWNGTLLWEYTYSSSTYRTHHDIAPLPNGNVLLIAWEVKTAAQAVQAGLNHSAIIWPDHIIEVQPVGSNGGNIVWKWHAWDHLIQDFDPTKDNYGVVANHPELLDINVGSAGSGDWMHLNGISYNPVFDQIVLSSHELDEIYVIDHSTTIQEAAGHTGGRSGKGGDILYRWGRPANYRAPGTQVFNVVHCSIWIPYGLPGGGNIMAFNNREGQGTSMVVELVPPVDTLGHYTFVPGSAFAPTSPHWSYTASGFYSNHLGGVQRLPNGNTLIVESTAGYMFEVNAAGTTQWSYQRTGEVVRAQRYPTNYPGILLTDVEQGNNSVPDQFELLQNHPNPFNPTTTISFSLPRESFVKLEVFNLIGQHVATLVNERRQAGTHTVTFDATRQSSGVYFYRLTAADFVSTRKLVVLR